MRSPIAPSPVVQALCAHELGQDAGVGGEAGDRDAAVVVDLEHLLLERGQGVCGTLHGGKHHVGLATTTNLQSTEEEGTERGGRVNIGRHAETE